MAQRDFDANYEQALLETVPLCYSVALALTQNAGDARSLARDAVVSAWKTRDTADDLRFIKKKLLAIVRNTFEQRSHLFARN